MWKDLTLQQKAEIMKMSVANGVTDINDIQQLYDGSVGHRFDSGGPVEEEQGYTGQTPTGGGEKLGNDTWLHWWLPQRQEQFEANRKATEYTGYDGTTNNSGYTMEEELDNLANTRIYNAHDPESEKLEQYDKYAAAYTSPYERTGGVEGPLIYMRYPDDAEAENTQIHEMTHALNNDRANPEYQKYGYLQSMHSNSPQEAAIAKILEEEGVDLEQLGLLNPHFYQQLMDFRQSNNVSPNKVFTDEDDIYNGYEWSRNAQDNLGRLPRRALIRILNEIAYEPVVDNAQGTYAALGGHLFKTGGPKKPTLGLIDRALIEGGAEGIYETTSRGRKPGQAGNKGNRSAHTKTLSDGSSAAQDIKPAKGHTWNELFAVMTSPKMQRALSKYGFDVLNETSAAMMAMTDATGEHLHVGKGIKGQQGKGQMFGGTTYGGYSVNPATGKISRTYTPSQSSSSDEVLAVKPSKDQGSPWIKFMADINTPGNISTSTKPSDIASIVATPSTDITDFSSISQEPDLAQADSQLPYDDSYNESIVNNPLWSAPYDLFEEDNILANGGHLLRGGGPYDIEARSDNTTNVVRPIIIKRDEDIKARSPKRQKLEQQKAEAREKANKITPANPRQASIGPYREKTALDKAGGRLYAAGEQREKDKKDREAAGTAFNALLKPLLPSTYYSAYDAYKKGEVTNVWDALAAPYLTGNWAEENPGEALAMDIVVPATIGKTATIANNIANRNLFSYKYIEPYHYIDKWKRAGNWAKHILMDSKPPAVTETTIANEKLINTPKFKEVYDETKKYRDDAYRKWLGLPERTPLYVDNGDGTWSYNLKYLSDNGSKTLLAPHPYPNGNAYDTLTGNGATVGASINPSTKTVSIIDPWDVHPFSRMPDINLSEKVRNMADKAYISAGYHPISRNWFDKVAYNYLGGRALNRMRYEFKGLDNLSDLINKYVTNRIRGINASRILGGKDFVLKQDIPYRASTRSIIEELVEKGQLNYPTGSHKSNLLVDFDRVGGNGLIR